MPFFEWVKLVDITKEEVQKRVTITNIEVPISILNSGQSHVCLTSHLFN
jgi:KDO2-lipid IV(A) lauroyltransferase